MIAHNCCRKMFVFCVLLVASTSTLSGQGAGGEEGDDCYIDAGTKDCTDFYGAHSSNDLCNDGPPYCDSNNNCNNLNAVYYASTSGWDTQRTQADPVPGGGTEGSNSPFTCISYHDCETCYFSVVHNTYLCNVNATAVYEDMIADWTFGYPCP